MQRLKANFKILGIAGSTYFLFEATSQQPPPPSPGIYVAVGEVMLGGDPSQRITRQFAGHTRRLDRVLRQLPRKVPNLPGMVWRIAYLEIREAHLREAWAADLQAGLAIRPRAA